MRRAQGVAREAWALCRELGAARPPEAAVSDVCWLQTFALARLDPGDVASVLLDRLGMSADARARGTVLCVRNWLDDPEEVAADWLAWARERIAAGECDLLVSLNGEILRGLQFRGDWRADTYLARATWELLAQDDTPDAEKRRRTWGMVVDWPWAAIQAGDWAAAGDIARRNMETFGVRDGAWYAIWVAALHGAPTPPDVVRMVLHDGAEDMDVQGLWGWYMVAREAAAAGEEARACDALRKALAHWTNPPLTLVKLCDKDAYWGAVRESPAVREVLDQKRRRIGPVCGELHYFPGW
jgi:hypothetical protein